MRVRSLPASGVLWLALSGLHLFGQSTAQPLSAEAATSLQAQIDRLRDGQAQILKELEDLKALLKERAERADTPSAKPQEFLTVNVFGEPFKGDPSARVAIMEYSDFDCSFCAKYAREIYPLLDRAYIQRGQVKYFFRDMPNPEHLNATFKARVARCAGEQERFWEAHDNLFNDQSPFDAPRLARFTKDLGLDEAQFHACITSDKYLEAIQQSVKRAAQARIHGTPGFLIGTLSSDGSILTAKTVFLGADSFEAFRTALDGLLNPSAVPVKAAPTN